MALLCAGGIVAPGASVITGLECEIAFRLGADIAPSGSPVTWRDVMDCVEAVIPAIEIVQKTGATLIGSPEVAGYATNYGIGFETDSCPLNVGGSAKLGSVRYTMTRADHSTGMHGKAYREGTAYAEPDGSVCGFVMDFDDGPIIWDTADTGVFGDMALLSQLYAPNLVIMPVGGKYTMGVKEAAVAAQLIRPRAVIPCHYDTFPNQAADIDELRSRINDLTPRTEVLVMKPGDTLSYP